MKSFSFKALALASIVVTGSAQGMFSDAQAQAFAAAGNAFTETGNANNANMFSDAQAAAFEQAQANANKSFVDKACEAIDNMCAKVSRPYENLANSVHMKLYQADYDKTAEAVRKVAGFPLNHHALSRTVIALGITAAIYKTYKYFTKPAADATEGENVEANEANAEVVA